MIATHQASEIANVHPPVSWSWPWLCCWGTDAERQLPCWNYESLLQSHILLYVWMLNEVFAKLKFHSFHLSEVHNNSPTEGDMRDVPVIVFCFHTKHIKTNCIILINRSIHNNRGFQLVLNKELWLKISIHTFVILHIQIQWQTYDRHIKLTCSSGTNIAHRFRVWISNSTLFPALLFYLSLGLFPRLALNIVPAKR